MCLTLPEGEFVIGRTDDCSLIIEDTKVSRRHVLILRTGDEVSFRDLRSATGTKLNGKEVAKGKLSDGDVLSVGWAELCFFNERPTELPTQPNSPAGLQKVKSAASNWSGFSELIERLRTSTTPKQLLEELLQGVLDVLGAERGYVLLNNENSIDLTTVASKRLSDENEFIALSSTVYKRALAEKTVVYIEDTEDDDECKHAPSLVDGGPRSILCGPLTAGEAPVGVLYVDVQRTRLLVTPEHIDFFENILGLSSALLSAERTRKALLAANNRLHAFNALAFEGKKLILSEGEAAKELRKLIDAGARQDTTVLITGETGTGKEMVALAVHRLSSRGDGPFIAVNCAALPSDMLEAELFGHEKGAFTGAVARKLGRFELAAGGTLFLDEVGELPLDVQVKLLRVLQERTITRLGGTKPIPLDFRLVCATNAALEEGVREGTIRADFYYRINVFRIALKPLRERQEDIMPLARHFLDFFSNRFGRDIKSFSKDAIELLLRHKWQGNIRELRNAIERCVVIEQCDTVQPSSLPLVDVFSCESNDKDSDTFFTALPQDYEEAREAFDRIFFERVIAEHKGNITAVAKQIGLRRNTIYRKLIKLGMKKDECL